MRIQSLVFAVCCALPAAAAPTFSVLDVAPGAQYDARVSANGELVGVAVDYGVLGHFAWLYGVDADVTINHFANQQLLQRDFATTPIPNGDGTRVVGSLSRLGQRRYLARQGRPFTAGTNSFLTTFSDRNADPTASSVDGFTYVGNQGSTQAFLFDGTSEVPLGDLAGGGFGSEAFDISLDGSTIVGEGTSALGTEAAVWKDGQLLGLGDLDGGGFASRVNGVSFDGSVIVGEATCDRGSEAFVWYENPGMITLEALLGAQGLDIGDRRLLRLIDVSGTGRVFVGVGEEVGDPATNPLSGQSSLFVATIPEPAIVAVADLGLLGLAAAKRSRARGGR
ncbi:MAG: hypothetical protein AAF430_12665 [Myxococcota bacterium]